MLAKLGQTDADLVHPGQLGHRENPSPRARVVKNRLGLPDQLDHTEISPDRSQTKTAKLCKISSTWNYKLTRSLKFYSIFHSFIQ